MDAKYMINDSSIFLYVKTWTDNSVSIDLIIKNFTESYKAGAQKSIACERMLPPAEFHIR